MMLCNTIHACGVSPLGEQTLRGHRRCQHAVANTFVVADMGDHKSPLRTLVLGPDRSGNMLEMIVLHFDDGREMVIHAMPMRAHYRRLLPRPPETKP